MPTKQGSLDLLQDPVAQELLHSSFPAHLAYVWKDGSPRVVPMAFHWDGNEIVMGSPPKAPKVKRLDGKKVAVTIDSIYPPFHVLYIRGTAHVSITEGVPMEYALAMNRYYSTPEAADAWLKQVGALFPKMARIAVTPEWVGILDFEQRFPSEIEKALFGG